MPGQIGTSIRANTRKIHSGDREADAIDAAGLAQARERFALLGRDVSQLSDDQLRNLVAELEGRFRDEALTSAAQAATIILDGVKADRWRILVGADAHKVDEMVRQSPERAYDIAFFDEFARAAGWTERLSLENPEFRGSLRTLQSPCSSWGFLSVATPERMVILRLQDVQSSDFGFGGARWGTLLIGVDIFPRMS
jgi:hypothetical protein